MMTERLEIVPAMPHLIRAALISDAALGAALKAAIPSTWPPEYLDRSALEFTLARLEERPEQAGWWMYFVVLRGDAEGPTLIGSAGYKGPISSDGTFEVGYGIVADRRRHGYATEVTRGLLARGFAAPQARRAIAETLPELTPSIGVLLKCGFRFAGPGSEAGVIRFALTREEYLLRSRGRP